jgi:MFS family permease
MADSRSFSRPQRAALTAAISCIAAVGIGLSLTIPLLSLELDRMGASRGLIGFNTAVAGVASLIVVPFVPRLAARYGVLALLYVAVLTVPAVILGFKLLYGVAWWFLLRFVLSAALGVLFVLSEYWITASSPARRRGFVMGIYATVLAVGFTLGPFILAAVGTSGWPPYLAGAALFSLATLPLLIAGNLTPVLGHAKGRGVFGLIAAAPAATLAAFVFGALETAGFALLPIYGTATGFAEREAALLVSAVALGNVALQIPFGVLSDRMDRRRILFVAALLGTVAALLIPAAAGNALGLGALLFVWAGLTGSFYTVGLAHLGARFSGSDLVSANAAFVLLYNVGLVVGPPVVGLSMDVDPPDGFAWSIAGFSALYLVVVGWRLVAAPRAP